MAKVQSLFDDKPQQEFNSLMETIKRQLTILNRNLQELKNTESTTTRTPSCKTFNDHRKNVLLILQTWIAQSFKSLEQIHDVRKETLKTMSSRKNQFGTSLNSSPQKPIISNAASTVSTNTNNSQQMTPPRHRPIPVDPAIQVANVTQATPYAPSSPTAKKYDDHVAIELAQEQTMLLADHQSIGSLRNRSTALNTIESTINELGTIYQQLAHMVSQQGEVVQRIDMNIEDMSINVQRGQNQLARYLRRVSSGRWLIAKLFAGLIVFIILFRLLFY